MNPETRLPVTAQPDRALSPRAPLSGRLGEAAAPRTEGLRPLAAAAQYNRRVFLGKTLAASAAVGVLTAAGARPESVLDVGEAIDVNATLGAWPERRLPLAEPESLVSKLRRRHIQQAWVGTFDALLAKDMAAVNSRLADQCRRFGHKRLLPFGCVNPNLPAWEEDLLRCADEHRMPGIRLYPNYHGYKLDEAPCGALLALAQRHNLIVQIALSLEDERTQHPLLRVPHVDASPLLHLLAHGPTPRIILLNWFRALRAPVLAQLLKAGPVYCDISTVEGVNGLGTLLAQIPGERLLFGSHAPFFYLESALLKMRESLLSPEESKSVRLGNATRLLGEGM